MRRAHGSPQKSLWNQEGVSWVTSSGSGQFGPEEGPLGPPNLADSGGLYEGVPMAPVPPPCSSSRTVRPGLLVIGTDVQGY